MKAFQSLLLYQEMKEEREELESLGLTTEDIEGYFDFYVDTYLELEENQHARIKDVLY